MSALRLPALLSLAPVAPVPFATAHVGLPDATGTRLVTYTFTSGSRGTRAVPADLLFRATVGYAVSYGGST